MQIWMTQRIVQICVPEAYKGHICAFVPIISKCNIH